VLQNLVSNAIKYTPKGRVLVGVRRRDNNLRIEVLDTGVGIPKSKQRDIFMEFHRLDRGARIARGLGLGLSIVERIARVLGHKVEVASASGKGSCFSIETPRGEAAPASLPAGESISIDPGQLAGVTALCIDNEPTILDGMETLLTGWGCTVIKAPDLDAAVTAIDTKGPMPNGLLVDYHLDNGNGLEAIDALRRHLHTDLPAILITADRSPRVRAEAHAANIQVLNKPIKPASLRAMLSQWRALRVAAAE
jgi:CheY-like chemotaxis protein/anti-sigma regulatory factor (Ser/Thr protein kinase)